MGSWETLREVGEEGKKPSYRCDARQDARCEIHVKQSFQTCREPARNTADFDAKNAHSRVNPVGVRAMRNVSHGVFEIEFITTLPYVT